MEEYFFLPGQLISLLKPKYCGDDLFCALYFVKGDLFFQF